MNTKLIVAIEEYLNGALTHKTGDALYTKFEKINPQIAEMIEKKKLAGDKEESLYEMIIRYINRLNNNNFRKKNGSINESAFYYYAIIDKSTWSDIRNNKIIPKKKTLLKLVIALELNEEEATDFMHKGGSSFDRKSLLDQIILAFIDLKIYDIEELYATLEYYRENGTQRFDNIYDSREMKAEKEKIF